jgi:hypothetical protein
MIADIPKQFPSKAALYNSVIIANTIESINIGLVILICIGQLLGKSLIKKFWSFFLCLQVALITYQNNKSYYPPNIAMTFDAIAGILALDAFPKDLIVEQLFGKYKEIIFPIAGILSNTIIFISLTLGLFLIAATVFLLKFLLKSFPTLLIILEKIKNLICWNIIIKTVQTGFLTYTLEAIKGIKRYSFNEQRNVLDCAISITTLILLIVLITLNFTFTLLSTSEKFSDSQAKAKYGAIYTGLDV